MKIENLRSPYVNTEGLFFFDRMIDKIRRRLNQSSLVDRTDIQTMFDYLDLDEGRYPKDGMASTNQ